MSLTLASPVPENCRSCGLYSGCRTWKMRSMGGPLPGDKRHSPPVDVLFIGSSPNWVEDEQALPFVGEAGQWVQTYCDGLEGITYAFTYAVKCKPSDGSAKKEHVTACSGFLREDLDKWKPKIIVAFGATALQAIWPSGPSTLQKAKGVHRLGDAWLVVIDHPDNHVKARRNLTAEYDKTFELICKLLDNDPTVTAQHDITVCMTWEQVLEAERHLATQPSLCFDFEVVFCKADPTRCTIHHPGSRPLCVSFCGPDLKTFVFPLDHPESPFSQALWRNENGAWVLDGMLPKTIDWRTVFMRILAERLIPKYDPMQQKIDFGRRGLPLLVGHNIKFDLNCLDIFFVIKADEYHAIEDTFLKHFSLDQSQFGNNLGDLANKYLGLPSWWDELQRYVDAVPASWGSYADVPLQVLASYNGIDVIATEGLRKASETWDVPPIYPKMLRDLKALRTIEMRGIPANVRILDACIAVYLRKYGTSDVYEHAEFQQIMMQFPIVANLGTAPKIFSPKFIATLAQATGMHSDVLTKTKNVSYGAEVIEAHAKIDKYGNLLQDMDGQPLIPYGQDTYIDLWRLIHRYRKGRTLLSTFLKPMKRFILEGRLHPSFNIGKAEKSATDSASDIDGGVETGRLSTSDGLNVLNLKHDKILEMIFEAPPGFLWFSFDYSQMELRRMADFCGIQTLIKAFQENIDPYKAAAVDMWGVPLDMVDKEMRQKSKRNVLARIYLEGAYSLAKRNKLDIAAVKEVDAKLSAAMPELEPAVQAVFDQVDRGEPFMTEFGRRRTFQADEKVAAWNNKIQSECGDICTQKLDELVEACHAPSYDGHPALLSTVEPLLIIHDAIKMLLPIGPRMWEQAHDIREIMLDTRTLPIKINVPLDVEIEYGPSWAKLRKVRVTRHSGSVIYQQNNAKGKDAPDWEMLACIETYDEEDPF